MRELKDEIIATGFFGETLRPEPVPGRWTVVLLDKGGELVAKADFGTEEEAVKCRDEITPFAERSGGTVEMVTPEGTIMT